MSEAAMRYIVARLVEKASDALEERKRSPKNLFIDGRCEAYYEMLDVLKSELDAHDIDPEEFGLTIDPDSMLQ